MRTLPFTLLLLVGTGCTKKPESITLVGAATGTTMLACPDGHTCSVAEAIEYGSHGEAIAYYRNGWHALPSPENKTFVACGQKITITCEAQ
jgi:hypothetical protein